MITFKGFEAAQKSYDSRIPDDDEGPLCPECDGLTENTDDDDGKALMCDECLVGEE